MEFSNYKSKQFFWLVLKVFITLGACYVIYSNIYQQETISLKSIIENTRISSLSIFVLLLFSVVNWSLEILKWSLLTHSSFLKSAKETLASLTASLLTPNRIGEYGAKALYYSKSDRKKIVFFNGIGNFYQMLSTLIFGVIGWFFLQPNISIVNTINLKYVYILGIIFILCVSFFFYKKWFQKIKKGIQQLSIQKHSLIFILSLIRHVVFSHQFYFLLMLFQIDISYLDAMTSIWCMYLIASIIPMLSFLDVVVKSSVAIVLFSLFDISSTLILEISLLMWCYNFAIPALIGIIPVISFQPKTEKC